MRRLISLAAILFVWQCAFAQDFFRVNTQHEQYTGAWSFPYTISDFSHFDYSDDDIYIKAHRTDEVDTAITYIPYDTDMIDSITFENDPDTTYKNKYKVFAINITTENFDTLLCYYHNADYPNENGARQDWYNCYISIDGMGQYPSVAMPGKVRGRGNSSWRWYPKKPMKFKLDKKSKVLGMGKAKEWVLLANFRDVTDLMNTFPFLIGKMEGVPYCSPVRYAEVFMNNEYMGLYQVAEQVEQGSNRVDVADDGGLLLTIDTDDGDDTWKYNTDTVCFWSKVYSLPIGVKYPKEADEATRNDIREQLAILENALKAGKYDDLDTICDINSYITMMQINELTDNADFPNRSMFLSKDVNGKWTFGPTWDYDAGYSFDYNTQYTSCTFFTNYRSLKVSPNSTSSYYNAMFKSGKFTREYIRHWNQYKDSLMSVCWAECMKYVDGMNEDNHGATPIDREFQHWPKNDHSGSHTHAEDVAAMQEWLTNRIDYLTTQINNFSIPSFDDEGGSVDPDPVTPTDTTKVDPEDPDPVDPADIVCCQNMTKVGSKTITATIDMGSVSSNTKQYVTVDFDSICALFKDDEITKNDLDFMALADASTGELTDQKTSSSGFYMTSEGVVCAYGGQGVQFKVGYLPSSNQLEYAYEGNQASNTVCTQSVYLVLDDEYYFEIKMNVTLTGSSNPWGGGGWGGGGWGF